MNCADVQKQIIDSLAAGEDFLADVAQHIPKCPACQNYSDRQRRLFRSIDSSLGTMVNAEVARSLLPSIRARIDAEPLARRFGCYAWGVAVFAAVAILVFGLESIRHRASTTTIPTQSARIGSESSVPVATTSKKPEVVAVPVVRRKRPRPPESRGAESGSSSQVIALPEEREAFARFIKEVPDNPEVALALTRPAPKEPETPVEIALLTIKPLEVESLESSE